MNEKKPKPVSKFEGMQPRQVVEHLRREGASLTCSLEPVDAEHLAALVHSHVAVLERVQSELDESPAFECAACAADGGHAEPCARSALRRALKGWRS